MLVLPIHGGSALIEVYTTNCQIELKDEIMLAQTQTHVAMA